MKDEQNPNTRIAAGGKRTHRSHFHPSSFILHPFFPVPLMLAATLCVTALSAPEPTPRPSPELDALAARAARAVERARELPDEKLQEDQISVTVADLRDPADVRTGRFRGDASVYPASVVKLFYLAAAHQWIEDGKLKETDELKRGLRDMIV